MNLNYIILSILIILSSTIFFILFGDKKYLKYGLLCIIIVTAAFFSFHFLLFAGILIISLFLFLMKESDISRLSYFILLLPLIPNKLKYEIPLPPFNQFFTLNYPLLLSLIILFPLLIKYAFDKKRTIFKNKIDKYAITFLIYIFIITFRDTTITNTIRIGFFNYFLLLFVPYFVISRTIKRIPDFSNLLKPFIFVAFMIALIGAYETLSHTYIYENIDDNLGTGIKEIYKLERKGFLRAKGPFLGPLPLSVYLVLAIGFTFFIRKTELKKDKSSYNFILTILILGIIPPIASLPWVGLISFMTLFFLFNLKTKKDKTRFIIFLIITLLIFLTFGRFLLSEGGSELGYRQELFKRSVMVIQRNLFFGSSDYAEQPELYLPSGNLRVDIVNTYLGTALAYGLIGLTLFLSIFIVVLIKIIRSNKFKDKHKIILGKVLVSVIISFMIMIFLTSLTSNLEIYIWIIFGLGAAYIKLK